ncbi:unnamed protein product [Sphenostylis stenocarpa]|uniref:Uncharacterized protein n=1 Tax=Sphenostylis stenocarpa TaxID=92480 RepID=A0AA86SQA8_9FABA|nr:unnamed protein product [Sphenostylis stenocarpa]
MCNPDDGQKNKGSYGLGYKPTREDRKRVMEERKERNLARLEEPEPRIGRIPIYDIKQSFRSAGWVNVEQVATAEEGVGDAIQIFVFPCPLSMELDNWMAVELPMMFSTNEM